MENFKEDVHMGLSENRVYIPNEIAIFHRDNDQQNHWVQWGLAYFQTQQPQLSLLIFGSQLQTP